MRLSLTLAEAAFGITKPLRVDTAVVCGTCNGTGAKDGSEPVTCSTCHGQGDITQIQRSFLGDIRTTQPCPVCRGYGTIIPNPCGECSGEGRVRASRTINVKIPPGVKAGNRIHLESQGEVGPGGGPAGDLYVELSVEPHETFTRNGDDLEVVVKLPMTAAALGTEVVLPTLEAERDDLDRGLASVRLTVPSGTQSGTAHSDQRTRGAAASGLRTGRSGRYAAGADTEPFGRSPARPPAATGRGPRREQPRRRDGQAAQGCFRLAEGRVHTMTEAMFLADLDSPVVGGSVAVTGDEGRHAAIVRRIRKGEVVLVSDGIGLAVRGPVLTADVNGLVVEVAEVLVADEPSGLRFTVVQALAKGDRSELALEMLTELGVDEIVPWQASRSVVRWAPDRVERALARWRSIVRESHQAVAPVPGAAGQPAADHRRAGVAHRRAGVDPGAARGCDRVDHDGAAAAAGRGDAHRRSRRGTHPR